MKEKENELIDQFFKEKLNQKNYETTDDFILDLQHRIAKKKKKKRLLFFFFSTIGLLALLSAGYFIIICTTTGGNNSEPVFTYRLKENKLKNIKTPLNKFNSKKSNFQLKINLPIDSKRATSINLHSKPINRMEKRTNKSMFNKSRIFNEITTEISKYTGDSDRNLILSLVNFEVFNKIKHSKSTDVFSSDSIEQNDFDTSKPNTDLHDSKRDSLLVQQSQFNNRQNKFIELQGYFGPQLNFTDFNSIKKASELGLQIIPNLSYNFGLNAQFRSNKIIFGSGVTLSKWGENYKWIQSENTVSDSVNLNLQLSIPLPFDTTGTHFYPLNINEKIYLVSNANKSLFLRNTQKLIQVPFYFGYTFNLKNLEIIPKTHLVLGINLNFQTLSIPIYSVDEVNNSALTSPFASFQYARILISNQFEVEFRKRYNNFYMFVSPYFRYGFNSISSGNLTKYSRNLGLNLGVGYSPFHIK